MTLIIISCCLIGLTLVGWNLIKGSSTYSPKSGEVDFYSLSCKTLNGDEYGFAQLKGKKVLIVNTASACGFTHQYKGLQKLHEQYGDNLVILGFPCNDFGKQERGDKDEIAAFCQKNYGVTFQLMEKVSIKESDPHQVYSWLSNKNQNGVSDHNVRWNFHKFTIDESSSLVGSFKSGVEPTDNQIISFASEK